MRKKIAAGNWKMNTSYEEGLTLAKEIAKAEISQGTEVILAAPFTHLKGVVKKTRKNSAVHVAAQNLATHASGAYTGEVSAAMLNSINVTHVLVGHSERRMYYQENAEILNQKIEMALSHGLTPIYCCGEPLEIRKANDHIQYVSDQLNATIFNLSEEDFSKLIIAYEPIWAIGTGETASPDQAQEMHAAIRQLIADKYNSELADNISILYGGSVKPANAKEIFAKADVDGGLVGGASLNADGFKDIINAF